MAKRKPIRLTAGYCAVFGCCDAVRQSEKEHRRRANTCPVLARTGGWYNVLDPGFNLHVRTEGLAQCWRVRRPSADGDVNALDCFNQHGRLVLTLFGERKPGKPELPEWRAHLDALEAACAA